MSTLTATFATADQALPVTPAPAGYHLTLTETTTGAVLTGSCALGQTSIVIADPAPGTYTATVAVVDATGAPLVPPVAAAEPVVVPSPAPTTISVAVPTSLTVSVS